MNLKWTRILSNATQTQISQATGINQGIVSLIENGKVTPSKWQKDAIEKALGYPIDWDSFGPEARQSRRTK